MKSKKTELPCAPGGRSIRKIAVIGYSGSGKSTLAKALSAKLGLPLLYLDTVHFLPGWVERPDEEAVKIVRDFLDANESWVIDGNYRKYEHERRMAEAELIVFMDYPRLRCFFRAWKRAIRYRGKHRESITAGCGEKFDAEFRRWILKKGRTPSIKARYEAIMEKYPDKTVRIRNDRELGRFGALFGVN